MNKRNLSHATAKGGYSSEAMMPLTMVSDQGLLDEIKRRGMTVERITQGGNTHHLESARLMMSPGTQKLTLKIGK